jgi:hypothetical protein
MSEQAPFELFDCSLARSALGRSCTNLRELLDMVQSAPDGVIEHHMMRCVLDDHFEMYEFPNDLARWSRDALGDQLLAEQLSLVDPYRVTLAELRVALSDAIEQRLWGLDRVPWSRPGLELHWVESRLIVYDTGDRFTTTTTLLEALEKMSRHSLFLHVHEAYRRSEGRSGDFSAWLESNGADRGLIANIRTIDFYFLNLEQLRQEIRSILQQYINQSSGFVEPATT